MRIRHTRKCGAGLAVMLLALVAGCFRERSVGFDAAVVARQKGQPAPTSGPAAKFEDERAAPTVGSGGDANRTTGAVGSSAATGLDGAVVVAVSASAGRPNHDTRAWLRHAHADLAIHLPEGEKPALLTEDLVASDGAARDVNAYFGIDPARLHTVLYNYTGLMHSSQASGTEYAIDQPAAPWPGFDDVWIPMDWAAPLEVSARLGLARDASGKPLRRDCIVVLPGIFGDNSVARTRQIAMALVAAGYHALAVEMRGCGQTEKRFPDSGMTFGTVEASDLLAVSDWLESREEVDRTGLIAFCWGSNIALVTAWEEGRRVDHPMVAAEMQKRLRKRDGRQRYRAGILVFSPALPYEDICDSCETEWSVISNPVLDKLQKEVSTRVERRHYACAAYSLRSLISLERDRSPVAYPGGLMDGYRYLRLYAYRGESAGDKFEDMRMPVLIVHAANDPLTDGQYLANTIALTENHAVAGLILPGGGHVGFAPYAADYFYGLIFRFFDPKGGAAAYSRPSDSVAAK